MYTVSKGPSKLVAKTRRGIPQNYEKFETHRDIYRKSHEADNAEIISVPKPVFQSTKKFSHHHLKNGHENEETLSPQHEEIVKYIHETWNMVIGQNPYDPPSSPESTTSSPSSSSGSSSTTPVVNSASPSMYYTDAPSPVLRDFKPFDLESWWGRRLYYNITKSL